MAKPTKKPDANATTKQHQVNGAQKTSDEAKEASGKLQNHKLPLAKPYAIYRGFS